jgi:hypothetical protein
MDEPDRREHEREEQRRENENTSGHVNL